MRISILSTKLFPDIDGKTLLNRYVFAYAPTYNPINPLYFLGTYPAFSIASHEHSRKRLCCGSISLASSPEIPKKDVSNSFLLLIKELTRINPFLLPAFPLSSVTLIASIPFSTIFQNSSNVSAPVTETAIPTIAMASFLFSSSIYILFLFLSLFQMNIRFFLSVFSLKKRNTPVCMNAILKVFFSIKISHPYFLCRLNKNRKIKPYQYRNN